MSKDRLIPQSFSKIHPTTRTPIVSTLFIGIATIVISGLFPLELLGQTVVMSSLLIYAIVCLAVLILRYTHPKLKRPFKVPFVPYVPAAGIISCAVVMCFLPIVTWVQVLLWLGLGMIIYFRYSIRHSKLRRESGTLAK